MSEEQIKEMVEQVGYREFYRYFQEKTTLIEQQREEIERLNNIINEINSIIEYWGYDKEHNDISSFRMAMKKIKDVLESDEE